MSSGSGTCRCTLPTRVVRSEMEVGRKCRKQGRRKPGERYCTDLQGDEKASEVVQVLCSPCATPFSLSACSGVQTVEYGVPLCVDLAPYACRSGKFSTCRPAAAHQSGPKLLTGPSMVDTLVGNPPSIERLILSAFPPWRTDTLAKWHVR